jgi:hypothetical protein
MRNDSLSRRSVETRRDGRFGSRPCGESIATLGYPAKLVQTDLAMTASPVPRSIHLLIEPNSRFQ